MASLTTIKTWFQRKKKPTEAQFSETWDSFRHKDFPVPIAEVDGLNTALAAKADLSALNTLAASKADLIGGKVPAEQLPDGFGASTFAPLAGDEIDYSVDSKFKKTLLANTTLSIANMTEGYAALLLVAQDSTGGRTLIIENKEIAINEDGNSTTLIGIMCTGNGVYEFSSNAGDTASVVVDPGSWQPVSFGSDIYGNGQLNAGVYSRTGSGGWQCDWINPSVTIPANQDFEYIARIDGNYNFGAALGVHQNGISPVIPGTNLVYGTYDADDNINFQFLELSNFNNQAFANGAKTQPYYLGIRRIGSNLFIISSNDKVTWTQEFSFANANSGALFPRLMMFDNSSISQPEIRFI